MESLEPEVISRALHVIAAGGAVLALVIGFALFEEYKARKHKPDVEPKTVVIEVPPAEAVQEAEETDRAKRA